MKTFKKDMKQQATKAINNLFTETYKKVERLIKLNRTIFIISKEFDFLYSVDCRFHLPQLCYRNHLMP